MRTVVIESRRRPPFWLRVIGAGAINLLGLWLSDLLGLVARDHGLAPLLLAALVLATVNIVFRPLMTILSIPLIIATLGFFLLVVNALMLWLTAAIVPHFALIGFWRTIGAVIVLWLMNLMFGGAMRDFTEQPKRAVYETD